jgi:hypothetical protein
MRAFIGLLSLVAVCGTAVAEAPQSLGQGSAYLMIGPRF